MPKVGATPEGVASNRGDGVGNVDRDKAGAMPECRMPNRGDGVGDDNGVKTATGQEYTFT